MCYNHSRPWHEGQTCAEYDHSLKRQWQQDEAASLATIAWISKTCPNAGCKSPIQKIDGCDHMTCKWTALSAFDVDFSCHSVFYSFLALSFSGLFSIEVSSIRMFPPIGTRCHYEFCWQCLAPYEPIRRFGNAGHRGNCRHHSDNLPPHARRYDHI